MSKNIGQPRLQGKRLTDKGEIDAEQAFQAYAILRVMADTNAKLADNPYFTALIDTAYARFRASFEVV